MGKNDIFGTGNLLYGFGPKKERDSRRGFTRTQKNEILAQQNSKCAICHKRLDPRAIEFDHIKAWADRGRTITQNGAALCPTCHKLKTHKDRLQKHDSKKSSPSNPWEIKLPEIYSGI